MTTHPEVREYLADRHIEHLADVHVKALLADRDTLEADRDLWKRRCAEETLAWSDEVKRADDAEANWTTVLAQRDAAEAKLAQIEKYAREREAYGKRGRTVHSARIASDLLSILTKGTSA